MGFLGGTESCGGRERLIGKILRKDRKRRQNRHLSVRAETGMESQLLGHSSGRGEVGSLGSEEEIEVKRHPMLSSCLLAWNRNSSVRTES